MLQSEGMQTGAGLVDGITQAIGAVGGQSVLFSQAIANRLEIHPSTWSASAFSQITAHSRQVDSPISPVLLRARSPA
jgi:hypothetical protein